jgi:putative flippase GtrA
MRLFPKYTFETEEKEVANKLVKFSFFAIAVQLLFVALAVVMLILFVHALFRYDEFAFKYLVVAVLSYLSGIGISYYLITWFVFKVHKNK